MRVICPALALALAATAHGAHRLVTSRVVDWGIGNRAPAVLGECAVGEELRPALGCPWPHGLATEGGVPVDGTPVRREFAPPPGTADGPYVVRLQWKPWRAQVWNQLPLEVRTRRQGKIVATWPVDVPPGGRVDVNAMAFVVPPHLPRVKSRPIRVPAGAVLRGGLGIDALGIGLRLAPVRFRVLVRSAGTSRVLLDRVLDPATPEARAWSDYELDLASLAGKRVRVAVRAVPVRPGLALPLIGAARVLAPAAGARPPNVLLVSLDTLRADHLGVYGSPLPTSPAIDAFAREGTVFEQAVAPYPSTTASHMSLFTGVYPVVHDIRWPARRLSDDVPTLGELLAARGYETLAVTEDGMLAAVSGFARGFVRYHEFKRADPAQTPGFVREGVSLALDWLARTGDVPWFLFLHTYVVHGPHDPPAEFDRFRTYRQDGRDIPIEAKTPRPIRERHAYAGEILYADAEFARLLEGLAARGELDRTIVVLVSDHGEAFDARHGAIGHGYTVADDVLRVPLVVRAPGLVPAGVRVAAPVSLVDVLPTVLDLLGGTPGAHVQGRSLRPLLERPDAPDFAERLVFAETMPRPDIRQLAVRRGPIKWIVGPTRWSAEKVYDVVADPDETRNVIGDAALAAEGKALAARYDVLAAEARARIGRAQAEDVQPDPETIEKLRALGYIE